jgi:DUF4097 and DUF4098 domain-containing protein YvlB
MNLTSALRSCAALSTVLLLAAGLHAKVTETFRQTYPLDAHGIVSVENINGDVTVTAWDKAEVSLEAEKEAPDDENLQLIKVIIDVQPGHLTVKTEHGKLHAGFFWFGSRNARGSVRYRLMVPAGAALDKVSTVNSDIHCTGVKGETRLSTVNGGIDARGLAGEGRFSTVNGSITISYDQLPASGRVVLDTVNGSNHLSLPKDANFELVADSVNGGVSCDFPIRLEKAGRNHLRGVVGQPGAQIKLDSVNGSLHVASH